METQIKRTKRLIVDVESIRKKHKYFLYFQQYIEKSTTTAGCKKNRDIFIYNLTVKNKFGELVHLTAKL